MTRGARTSAVKDGDAPQPRKKPVNAIWSHEDVEMMVKYLHDHSAEAGDNATFKKVTWEAVSKKVEAVRVVGGVKDWQSCKNKHNSVRNSISSPVKSL